MDERGRGTGNGSARTARELAGLKVLVVEPDETLRMAVEGLLRSAGASVVSAADAAQAMLLMEADADVGVVLTDLRLPGQSGLWLAEWCAGFRPFVPVIVMSAQGLESGAVLPPSVWRYIRKPLDAGVVLGLLAEALGQPRGG